MDLYLEDILNYSDNDLGDTQSLHSESDNENKSQDYYPQYQSFSYSENIMNSKSKSKIRTNLLNPNIQSKSLSHSSKDDSEYKEIFNIEFFANHNKHKRQ